MHNHGVRLQLSAACDTYYMNIVHVILKDTHDCSHMYIISHHPEPR